MINISRYDKYKCIHDPNDNKSTLIMLAKRNMSYPPEFDYFCPDCKRVFRFYRNEDGKFVFKNT